ncbi:MAG: iron-sulfur cluster assembly protein [Porphyromonas sp.]|nr:iron-sulfur cluster assembly protein [Porphyromonas sp.]
MSNNKPLQIEESIVKALRTVYDPEIPVNIYDLGLVYDIDLNDETGAVTITMTLTSPNCPVADFIVEDAKMKVEAIKGVESVSVELTFDPPWGRDMMSEEAMLELGLL